MNEFFRKFAQRMSLLVGSPWAFGLALMLVVAWGVSGPIFDFSQTWQLVINTGTTIVTFLMIFLVQNAQNRDAEAMQLKLDDLIQALDRAHNSLIEAEKMSEQELVAMRAKLEEQIKRKRKGK